jgi:hypothetical protein
MSDVQETVQSGEHDAEAKDKAPELESIIQPFDRPQTRASAVNDTYLEYAKYQTWAIARSMPQNMTEDSLCDPSAEAPREDGIAPEKERDADEPKVEKTTTTTTTKSWKFFTEGIVYTAGVAALHHFVYPERVGSTVIIACSLLAVLGIRLKHKTTNNESTKITYPPPKKMSATDID